MLANKISFFGNKINVMNEKILAISRPFHKHKPCCTSTRDTNA